MWRQVVAQSPGKNAPAGEVLRYDVGWKALNTLLRSGRSLSGHERNCCFLNTRGGRFADMSAAADLDFDDDGRVLALCDWDMDGDIDFWIANRTGPQARFLRNDHDNDHGFVAFRLEGVTCNRDAIGARVELHLSDSADHPKRIRTLRAGEGYLAQSSKWLHFGLGDHTDIERLVVFWPDGKTETITGVAANRRYRVKQFAGQAIPWDPPEREVQLTPSKISVPPSTDKSRIVLIAPIPIPVMHYTDRDGEAQPIASPEGRARLINLWASWCQPCLAELNEWTKYEHDFNQNNLEIVAVNVDEPDAERDAQMETIDQLLARMSFPFDSGYGSAELALQFDVLQRAILSRQRTLPVPSSFLIDASGNLRVIYKGPVSAEQLIADARLLDASAEDIVAASVPYEGIWLGQPAGSSPNQIAVKFVEGGFLRQTEEYIQQLANMQIDNPAYNPAEAQVLLGAIFLDQQRWEESAAAFRAALKLDPSHRQSHIELAGVLLQLNQPQEAAEHFEHALRKRPDDPELRLKLGMARYQHGDTQEATRQFAESIRLRPAAVTHHHLGNAFIRLGRIPEAVRQFDAALKLNEQFSPSANNLAWLLATHDEDSVRDGKRAVELAERVCSRDAARTSGNLDTLAASYAEAGRFAEAVQAATEAIRLAKAKGDVKTSQRLQSRLALYQQELPYRQN